MDARRSWASFEDPAVRFADALDAADVRPLLGPVARVRPLLGPVARVRRLLEPGDWLVLLCTGVIFYATGLMGVMELAFWLALFWVALCLAFVRRRRAEQVSLADSAMPVDLTPDQRQLLHAARAAIAAAPETYDERELGDECPSPRTPGPLAAHVVLQRQNLVEVAESLRPDIGANQAIGMAACMGLGVNALPPLLDPPWPSVWFEAANVYHGSDGSDAIPTLSQTVAVLDAVLAGRLTGCFEPSAWRSRAARKLVPRSTPAACVHAAVGERFGRRLWLNLDLTINQFELLQAARDAIADAPETYDERQWGNERPSAQTPGPLAAHIVAQRDGELRELADSVRPALDHDAIGMAASVGLGLKALPPLLDAPWPWRWFAEAGVASGHQDYSHAMPTATQTVAVLDAVLDGRLTGSLELPLWRSRLPDIGDLEDLDSDVDDYDDAWDKLWAALAGIIFLAAIAYGAVWILVEPSSTWVVQGAFWLALLLLLYGLGLLSALRRAFPLVLPMGLIFFFGQVAVQERFQAPFVIGPIGLSLFALIHEHDLARWARRKWRVWQACRRWMRDRWRVRQEGRQEKISREATSARWRQPN